MPSIEQAKHLAGSFFTTLSLALMLFAYLLAAICLYHAMRDGRLIDIWTTFHKGYHELWRHYEPAITYLNPSFIFILPSAFLHFLV